MRATINPLQLSGLRLYAIPMLYVVGSMGLAVLTTQLDRVFKYTITLNLTVESGQMVLSAIASGMLAMTGIVFSMVFVLVQFGSTAFSPRLVTWFVQDVVVLNAMGVFSATFLYALIALGALDRSINGEVPFLTMMVAYIFIFASVIMFIALTQRMTILQISNVLHTIGQRGRNVVNELYREDAQDAKENVDQAALLLGRKVTQTFLYSGGPAAVVEVRLPLLFRLACQSGGVIELEYAVGDTLVNNAAIMRVYDGKSLITEAQLRRAVVIGRERTMAQDPKLALRLLVDIAIRALSPAINDPTTAVQALNQIEDLLRRLGTRKLDIGVLRDDAGELRVLLPSPDWDDFLALALDEIRYHGANSLQVMRRMSALLDDLEEVVPPRRRKIVQEHYYALHRKIRMSFSDPSDRAVADQVDRQGIGLSRDRYDGEPDMIDDE